MFAELVDFVCSDLPGAAPERPFGPDTRVWTIGGRMFAIQIVDGSGVSVACRSPLEAHRLVQEGKAVTDPYLKGRGWALFPYERSSPDELRARIETSYNRVRNALPDAVELTLPTREKTLPQ